MEYFGEVTSIEELKSEYLNYLRKWKDDTDIMADVNEQYKDLLLSFGIEINDRIDKENTELPNCSQKAHYEVSKDCFAEILNKIISYDMNIEIIGQWIWCFDSYEYHEQLKELGFWYSASKKAWVYSGSQKKQIRSHNKIADVRKRYGSEVVKSKEEVV